MRLNKDTHFSQNKDTVWNVMWRVM